MKIDAVFVRQLTTDPRDRAIVSSVVSLAHALGLTVVAEGVESAGQLDVLARVGCDLVQGHLVSAARSASGLVEWLARRPPRPWDSPASG